jgi:DNA-binding transcriptional LysR family regulator
VSLTQLQYFVAVAEEGKIGRAARRLHISQPPLSRQLMSLEHVLGVRLFERSARGVRLLPQGELLLGHARRILESVELALQSVRRAAEHTRESAHSLPDDFDAV